MLLDSAKGFLCAMDTNYNQIISWKECFHTWLTFMQEILGFLPLQDDNAIDDE